VAIHAIASSAAAEVKDETLSINDVGMPEGAASKSMGGRAEQVAQALVLAVLFAVPALICVRAACVIDLDIWWHLRTGEWMLLHHAVPHVDLYSGALAGRPWLAYSWLFELVTVKLYQWLGLAGIVAYSSAMILAITVALFHMVRRLQGDFTLVVLLTFAACYSMGHLYTPRPWLFTILFFILEMDILIEARKTGRVRELAWLPVIFALWANVHIQFVDGLFVLGLAWVEAVVALWWKGAETRLRPAWLGLALVASLLATLLNPYGWRIYQAAFDLATQGGALNLVTELQAMPFRGLPDFLILLLALGSAAALAWRRRFQPFETALLAFAAVLAFRSQRDVWVMAVVGAMILASSITGSEKAAMRLPKWAPAVAVLAAGLAVLAGSRVMRVNNAQLETQLAKNLPVSAVEAIRAKGYAGPLYNNYNWGGYLVWALRMPVSIDGRQNLYGDQRIDRSLATWNAEPDWASDAQLTSAGVVIGPVKAPLTQLLRMDPRFQLMYEDKVAAVFVARR
jgi:hypothetical protein